MRTAVIGAGPAGWAAATKLLELGHHVTVFTGDLSPSFNHERAKEGHAGAINLKLLHGSDYPYRSFPHGPQINQTNVNLASSFAFSGLSLVWGATMLPYSDRDISGWPITTLDLAKSYQFITERVPIAGRLDDLAQAYDPYLNQNPLLPTKRITEFFERSEQIRSLGITIGSSRLAVRTSSAVQIGCIYCGECLSGCPTNQIWFAPEIKKYEIEYKRNYRVLSVKETEGKVSIDVVSLEGEVSTFAGFDKIFIGAGNIETFRILANSKLVPSKVKNKDSSTFFVPFLLSGRYSKPEAEKNTLSQAFLRIENREAKASQIQIYDYSEDLISRARKALPLGKYIPKPLLRIPLRRLFVGIGYLDSEDSSEFSMCLDSDGSVHLDSLITNAKAQRQLIANLMANSKLAFKQLGIRPLRVLIQYALPGEGVHSGGWLPMGKASDLTGRPIGVQNIHVIDSSVFPTIPAGAITFTVMANAVRIAEVATL
jgi:ferredoxin